MSTHRSAKCSLCRFLSEKNSCEFEPCGSNSQETLRGVYPTEGHRYGVSEVEGLRVTCHHYHRKQALREAERIVKQIQL